MRLLTRLLGRDRCSYCGGHGSYLGHSPLDSLATFRRVRKVTCVHCQGSGREPTWAVA
jgi:DnaJ-class molecular chaperone